MTSSTSAPSLPEASGSDRLWRDYRGPEGAFDELTESGVALRPHWRSFVESLSRMDDAEIADSWRQAERLLHEDGVTYDVHGDSSGEVRPWRLDPIPLLMPAGEWRELERGLAQRARLLNAVLQDLYGEQRLLTSGLLPAALVFGNAQYLRPVHGIRPPDGRFLQFLAIDLARGSDGRWRVLGDRTQAPIGAGYALENRVIMTRILPEAFRDGGVQRLAAFLQGFREHLLSLAPGDQPRIVIHAPGPTAETYFEHAYLARYLGLPLVEAADLTVRDRKVFLKTLTGLQPVHLIWRRIDSEIYDPLELRSGSPHGIPGIVEALRAGNVRIVNALGSGLIECDALLSFLPALARELLGEELLLPATATWWCGEEAGRRHVLDNLADLVIRPTFASRSIMEETPEQIIGGGLGAEEREALAARINADPAAYVGQDLARLSTAPSWQEGRLQPQPIALRAYVATDGDDYRVMPGGLIRTSADPDPQAVFMRQGDASKDCWVLQGEPARDVGRASRMDQLEAPRRSGQDIPSRTADNLFWLGRYAERLEGSVRMLRSLLFRLAGETADDDPALLHSLRELAVDHGYLSPDLAQRLAGIRDGALERDLGLLVFDPDAFCGIATTIANLHRTGTAVRERLSRDAWRVLQEMEGELESYRRRPVRHVAASLHLQNQLLRLLAALLGMQMENLTRNFGWRLIDMGRRIERARLMGRLIGRLAGRAGDAETASLHLLLELADSSMTYRTRYLASPQATLVIDLLLKDGTNPRAIAFQLDCLDEHLEALPRDPEHAGLGEEQQLLTRLRAKLDLADLSGLASISPDGAHRAVLSALMLETGKDLDAISDRVSERYFSHAEPLGKWGPLRMGTPS